MARGLAGLLLAAAATTLPVVAQDYKIRLPADHTAIGYWTGSPRDPAQHRLIGFSWHATDAPTRFAELLDRLDVRRDTQMLVFSKTSLQASRISPQTPRAIYFSDDVAVGYVPGVPTVEVAAIDSRLGPVFYAVSLDEAPGPSLTRGTGCLQCHHGANTAGVPGLYVGSVVPGPGGAPLRDDSAIVTDHRTPFRDRWGGWYVTARRGQQRDRANAVVMDASDPQALLRESQQNLVSLAGRFDRSRYPAETSDIVALMTFEHQTQMINQITRVAWQARLAHGREVAEVARDGAVAREVEALVEYMLFVGEAPLAEPVEGVSPFVRTFASQGPHDSRGRSLREFDLETRLFRYPLSYLIYSPQFEALPQSLRTAVYVRLREVLTDTQPGERYRHLSAADRRAILEILAATKPEAGTVDLPGVTSRVNR